MVIPHLLWCRFAQTVFVCTTMTVTRRYISNQKITLKLDLDFELHADTAEEKAQKQGLLKKTIKLLKY